MQTNTEERSLVLGLKNQRPQFVFEKLRHICDNMAGSDHISVLFILIGGKNPEKKEYHVHSQCGNTVEECSPLEWQ